MTVSTSVFLQRLPHAHDLPLPSYGTDLSAGFDLAAAIDGPLTLNPMERALIPTGFSYAFGEQMEGQIRPRSGLALKHGLTILNTPGTIDADYRGEVKVILINLGQDPFIVERGMRIAQMVIAPLTKVSFHLCDTLPQSTRDQLGFGSTGLFST